MALWQHGEAARADPVLLNMQAGVAAELARISPEAAAKGRVCLNGWRREAHLPHYLSPREKWIAETVTARDLGVWRDIAAF